MICGPRPMFTMICRTRDHLFSELCRGGLLLRWMLSSDLTIDRAFLSRQNTVMYPHRDTGFI